MDSSDTWDQIEIEPRGKHQISNKNKNSRIANLLFFWNGLNGFKQICEVSQSLFQDPLLINPFV